MQCLMFGKWESATLENLYVNIGNFPLYMKITILEFLYMFMY